MTTRNKFLVLGTAGVLAVGGAGLYAGFLTTTTAGLVGAGNVALQASCASAAVIEPSEAVWDEEDQMFQYDTLTVDYTAAGTTCLGQHVTANVYALVDGEVLSTNEVDYVIDAADVTATEFDVELDDAVNANIVDPEYNYGLVIQTP